MQAFKNGTELKFINPWKLFVGIFIPNWLIGRPELTFGAKFCYGILCQFSGRKGRCFPKQEQLASRLGVSTRQVVKYIKQLEKYELIIAFKNEFRGRNVYRFLDHPWMESKQPKVNSSSHLAREREFTLGVNSSSLPTIRKESVIQDSIKINFSSLKNQFTPLDTEIEKSLGKIATNDMIKNFLLCIDESRWWLVQRFLEKRYPGSGGSAFSRAQSELITEQRKSKEQLQVLSKEQLQTLTASIGAAPKGGDKSAAVIGK